jgi:type VI secretion system Hcp family effector
MGRVNAGGPHRPDPGAMCGTRTGIPFKGIGKMATNMFVQFGKIKGECEDKYHDEWCEITSLGQSFNNKAPPLLPSEDAESGTRRGKHAPVKVSKPIDKASTELMEMCWNGEALGTVLIECFRAGGGNAGQPIKYISIKLESVIIKQFKYSVNEGSLVSEDLELVAAKATYEYRQMDKELGTAAAKLSGLASITLGTDDFSDSKSLDLNDLEGEALTAEIQRRARQRNKPGELPGGSQPDQ